VAAGLVGMLIGGSAMALAASQGAIDPDRARIEGIVRDYILEHPEIIPEAVQRLQDRELAKVVNQNRAALETPFAGAWAGAEDGDVVLVEFYDYACGFCEKSGPDVARLLAEDKKLKVVWRELPVLGEDSVAAARASLDAAKQNKFRAFHDALFAADRPDADAVSKARAAAGVAPRAETPDLQAEVESNYQLASALKATGTPLFVVGDKVLQGAVGYDALKQAVAEARARRES
jgi:protein-disulfide isomerase